jgi:plasmid stabilization system protein ParE
LGDAFLAEVMRSLDRIVKFPEAWPQLSLSTRRCRTVGFPYGIVYQVLGDRILIVVVMHLQRQPNYWADRL